MYTLLLAPPIANPFYPPLGLPSLAAAIRASGRHRCKIVDLSIETVRHLLAPEFIETCEALLAEKMDGYGGMRTLPFEMQADYFRVARAYTMVPKLRLAVRDAVKCFGDAELFQNKVERRRAIEAVDDVFELIGAVHSEYSVNRAEFRCGQAPFSLREVVQGVKSRRSPVAEFLEKRVCALVGDDTPGLIGISINYYGQLIAGLELARYVRSAWPDIPIAVGGSLMPEVGKLLASNPTLATLFDFVIAYEGETALVTLLDCLETQQDPWLLDTPNLMTRLGAEVDVKTRHRERMEELPTPDFDDLNLSQYLSPSPILPLLTSRGCYWGACAFCTHFHTYGNDYRTLQANGLLAHIERLRDRHGCGHFYFVDESLAPSKASAFAKLLLDNGLTIRWGTEIRFERALTNETLSLMARAGCKVLSFGLESGSQRVLDLMGKGIAVEDVDRVLQHCAAVGIAAHAMCIIGFPGESKTDFQKTVELLSKHQHRLALLGFSPFTLNTNSIVHQDPGRFGVQISDGADALRPDLNFTVAEGLGQKDAYGLYDEITGSEMVREIDERTSVPTREHLLLVESDAVREECQQEATVSFAHFVLPFSIAAAERAQEDAHLARQALIIGGAYDPNGQALSRGSFNVVVANGRRIFEVEDSVVEVLAKTSRGEQPMCSPDVLHVFCTLMGAEYPSTRSVQHA
ncbi:B12-binding domain-containing radical SAM protein [Tsuneonella sp. SYSU-LHT278]|uniref:B12-binding domain-containing radical SAM protein n=1 Tax=Tsuneonella sediminis TaxID=3416089 RepID=UPI003F794856